MDTNLKIALGEEREACAKLAEWYAKRLQALNLPESLFSAVKACQDVADMIRARGQEDEEDCRN
jgi:hypothetical protein